MPKPLPILTTDRLILRPLTMTDAADVFAYAYDPEITKFLTWEAHKTIEESKQFISNIIADYHHKPWGPWAIVDKSLNDVIGTITIDQNEPNAAAEHRFYLGYCLGKEYWGKGLMVEAANKVINHIFLTTDAIEIVAWVQTGNHQSERVLEKVGMRKDSTGTKQVSSKGELVTLECWFIKKLP